jgi:hypothetical protein
MSMLSLPTMTAPLLDELDIPFHEIGPIGHAPRLALVAGLHSNDLNGIFVLSRLTHFLNSLHANERPEQRLLERVLILPAVNMTGFNSRDSRTLPDTLDIASAFADPDGDEPAQRIATAVLQVTRQAYYRVAINNIDMNTEELPQVWLYEPNDDERATACLFGLPAVSERPLTERFNPTLVNAWRAFGGENFTVQAGQIGTLQTHHCEKLYRAIVAFLTRSGIIEGISIAEGEEDLHYFGKDQTFAVVAAQSGMFVPRSEVGRWLRCGDCIGHIYDARTGDILVEVRAPRTGLLSTLRSQPFCLEGDLVARIQTR